MIKVVSPKALFKNFYKAALALAGTPFYAKKRVFQTFPKRLFFNVAKVVFDN
ncbi:MAG: hypothetical protein HRT88_15265 [Lentisphaeraceae bacterium]|nr:hypothetical protein [Lentisphaeraceae bacterium]